MYPKIVDLATVSVFNVNGISFVGENAGDYFGYGIASGNVFNSSYPGIVIGAPYASGLSGKGYIVGGPLKIPLPTNGIIPIASAGAYFPHVIQFTGGTNEMICTTISVEDVDQDGIDDIFCGSYGANALGGGNFIKGGSYLKTISSINLNTLNGVNGCRFTSFFGVGDDCGFSSQIIKNMTGNGNNAFVLGCLTAFSSAGAVIVIPYTPTNFCPGGTITGTNVNQGAGTYFKGIVAGGQLGRTVAAVDINLDGAQDLFMGGVGLSYVKLGGPSALVGVQPLLMSGAELTINGRSGDSSGDVSNIGDIFGNGYDSVKIGAYTDSPWGQSNAGRADIIKSNKNLSTGILNLPYPLTGNGTIGFSIYDNVAQESLGLSGGKIGNPDGDAFQDFSLVAYTASPLGRTNAGKAILCFGGNSAFSGNNTLIYQDLIAKNVCTEFAGGAANELVFRTASIKLWNNDTISDFAITSIYHASMTGIARVIFGDAAPKFITQPFINNLAKCGSITLNLLNLNATDQNDPQTNFIYDINVSNGNATLGSNPAAIFNATYAQLANSQVNINRNCNNSSFSVSIGVKVVQQGVTKLAFLPPQPLTVNFRPNVSFPLLNQNGNVRLTSANLDAICDSNCGTTPSAFTFKISGTGAFTALYPNLNTPVSTVSKLDLLATAPAGVYLTSDGLNNQPLLDVTAMDNSTGLTSTAFAQPVPFRSIPSLQNKSLFAVYNRTVPVTANQLFASQKYNFTDVSNLILSTDCQNGGFYSYKQQNFISTLQNPNITSGDIGFSTSANGAPKCNVTVSDGVLSSTTALNFTYYPGPKFGNKNLNLRINQGVTNQSLSLNSNFPNFLNGINYVLNLFSPQHISYTCYDTFGNPQPICSLDDVQQGRLVQSHDGSLSALNDGVATITDTTYDLSDEGRLLYTLVKRPEPVNFTFPTLYQVGAGSSFKITTDMLDSLCDAPCNTNASSLLYTFDVQHGSITNQFSVPITQGTKGDVLNGNLYLTSSGINQKPIISYYTTDTANSLPYNPLMSGPFAANIPSFIDVPSAFFTTWTMLEGIQFNLTRSLANGTSNYIPNSGNLVLDFEPSSLQNLQITNGQAGPATSLTLSAIDANNGVLIGGPGLPAGQARICYSTQCSPYQAIPVSSNSFGFAPRLNSMTFTLAEGQRQLLRLDAISFSNLNAGDSTAATLVNYRATVSSKQFIEFYLAGTNTILSSFTLEDVKNNLVEIENTGQASSFQMTLTDTSRNAPFGLTSSFRQVQPTFGYKPVVVNNNAIEVNQTNSANAPAYFGTEALSASSLSSQLSTLNVLFSQQPACTIDSRQNPGSALVSYGDLQSRSTRVTVTDPNSPTPCKFNVSFIDPNFNVTFGPFPANVNFRDIPVILTTFITCRQGTDQILSSSNLNAKDNANNLAGIVVKWLSLSNAALSFDTGSSLLSINSYRLSEQAANKIHLKPNNGAAPPIFVIQIIGNSGLATLPIILSQEQGNLIFTVTHAAPVLSAGILAPTRGVPYSLTPQAFGVTISDPTVQFTDVVMKIRSVSFAWVQRVNNSILPSIDRAITQYNYGESLSPSLIEIVPDGSANEPSICIEAETPGPEPVVNLGGAVCPPVILLGKVVTPAIIHNQIEAISRDEELVITPEMLSGLSGFPNDKQPGALEWEMICQNAVLQTNATGAVPIIQDNKFTALNITQGNIRMKASDTNNAVTCTAKATNTDGVSTAPQTTIIKQFREKYYKPIMTAYTLPLEMGLSSYPILSSYLAAVDNPGNIGGKLYPLTQPSQMSFNISNMRGISLPPAYDASNWAMISAAVLNTLSLTDADPTMAAFNISACNLAMNCSDPMAAVFNWQPARSVTITSGGGTSVSLIGGNATTYGITVAAVITGIGVLSRIFAPILSRVLNSDNLEQNPLVIDIFGLIDKELRISNFSTCFYTSGGKRGKFIRACGAVVNKLEAEGVQTQCASNVKVNNKICSDCCSKDKKENDKKREFEYDKDGNQLLTAVEVTNLSGIIFSHIKSICLPKKRSGCRKCCDLTCGCQSDLKDKAIVANVDNIANAVLAELRGLKNLYIRKNLKVTTVQENVAVVDINSPSENTSAGRPLLLSSAAVATSAGGIAVLRPDHKSDEPSAEVSGASAHSADALMRPSNDGSQSPSASGVLLFSNAASSVPGADRTTVALELASFGVSGSRSQTPPPLSGAQSITSTPPSPPAMDPPPPPPMSSM